MTFFPDSDEPIYEWATRTTYPPDRGGVHADRTEQMWTDGEAFARKRAAWHLSNGATEAVVLRRPWTPGEWEDVT